MPQMQFPMEINFIDVKTNGRQPQNQLRAHVQYGTWKGMEQAPIVTGNAEWSMLCCTNRITFSELCFVYEGRRACGGGEQCRNVRRAPWGASKCLYQQYLNLVFLLPNWLGIYSGSDWLWESEAYISGICMPSVYRRLFLNLAVYMDSERSNCRYTDSVVGVFWK